MKRKDALALIRYVGYHEDKVVGTRTMIENRISVAVYQREFDKGRKAKAAGVKCGCLECRAAVRS